MCINVRSVPQQDYFQPHCDNSQVTDYTTVKWSINCFVLYGPSVAKPHHCRKYRVRNFLLSRHRQLFKKQIPIYREDKQDVYGKQQTVVCHKSMHIHSFQLVSINISTIVDKFLWDTGIYFSPMHILRTSDASPLPPLNVGHKLVHFQPCTLFSVYFPQATLNGGGGVCKRTQNT